MSQAWDSGLASQFWRLFYYRELTWWLQFPSLSLPGLGICCNHAFLALWYSLGPSGNLYPHTSRGGIALQGPAQVVLSFFGKELGGKKRYLQYSWAPLVIHMEIMPLPFQ